MANNKVQVSLAFQADTRQAKQAINELYNNINKINTLQNFSIGERMTKDMQNAVKTASQLQAALANAVNADTGKLDLTKFNKSMRDASMSIEKYRLALQELGPDGERAFIQLTDAIQGAEIPLRRTGKLASELWTTLKNTARWQISASIIQGFQGALQKAYGYAQDLNESLNNIRIVTGASVADMSKFAVEANKAAKALSTTTTEYTNASLIYYQQGLSAAEVKERTDVTIKMANVARESAETISDQMTAVWNNFDNGSKSLEYYADVMTALGAATASSTAEITTGLEKFAAVAETVGLSYEYATTALATITDTTRQSADVVGNALKTLFARIQGLSLGETLEDGTDLTKYSEALMKVGISIKEQDGSLKDMDTILDEMANKWGTLAKDQQVALAQTVAGVRQYTQLVALMDNWDKFQKNLSVAQGAEGALQEQADIYAESWEAARERVQASLESIYQDLLNDEFFIDLTDGIAHVVTLVDTLIDALGGVSGVLTGLGVIATKLFSKQIAGGIRNLTFNAKQAITGGSEEIALKRQASYSLRNWSSDGTHVGAARADGYKRIDDIQQKMLDNAHKMTEEEVKQNQLLIERQKKLNELELMAAQEVSDAEARTNEIANNLDTNFDFGYEWQADPASANNSSAITVARRLVNKGTEKRNELDGLYEYQAALTMFSSAVEEVGNNTDELDKVKKALKDAFPNQSTAIDNFTTDLQQLNAELEAAERNAQKASADLKNLALNEAGVTHVRFSDDNQAPTIWDYFDMSEDEWHDYQISDAAGSRELEREFNGLFNQIDEAVNEYSTAKQHELVSKVRKSITTAEAEANHQSELAAMGMRDFADGLSDITSGASQVVFGLSALQGAFSALTDPDLTGLQKFSSIMTSLLTAIPMVVGGLGDLARGLDLLKSSNTVNAVLTTLSKNSKIASLGIVSVDKATGKAVLSTQALRAAIGKLLLPLGLLAAAVAAVVFIFKQIEAQKPENQLKKVQEEAVALEKVLNDTQIAAERLKNEIEGYESAVETLNNCVEGTEEWEQALKDANAAALELLKNNPELYGTGAVKRENGRIIIDDEAYKELQNKQESRQNILNGAYASKQKEVRDIAIAKEWSDIEKIIDKADYKYSDEADAIIKLLERQYSYGDLTVEDLYQYKDANNPAYSALLNDAEIFSQLENAINELSTAVAENTIATEIESEQAVEGLLNNKYTDAVVKGVAKSYNATVKAEKDKFTWKDSNAELFELYRTQQGISSSAIYSASENKYTINGTDYEITRDAMIEALSVANAQGILNNNAKDLQALLGDENSKESRLISEGINSLSAVELNSINKETLDKLVDLGAIEQTIVNQINSIKIDPDNITLEDTLSADLQQTFVNAFGKDWANEYAGDLIKQIPQHMRDEFAQAVAQTNWSDVDSAQGFHDLLAELGGWMPEDEIEGFIQKMMDANDAVKQLDLDATKESFYSLNKELDDLEEGGTISAEVFASLTEEQQSYFTLMGDGTYMLTEDAKEFYELVRQQQLDEVREKQQQVKGDMDELQALYDSYQKHGAGKNLNNSAYNILREAGWEASGVAADDAALIQEKIAEYEKLNTEYEKNSEFLQSTARSQQELSEELEAGNISEEAYKEGLKRLNAELKNTEKSLKSAVSGMGKYAPELEKAMTALTSFGEGKLNPTEFGESIKAAITAVPEFTGAIWSAYSALTSATPGTEEYTAALTTLQTALSEAASSEIMSGIGEVAESTFAVLDDELASTNEQLNAIANLNAAFGADIFGFDDIGIENLNNLRDALKQDEEAWMKLQQAVAKGIMIKYGMTTDEIDAQSFFETHSAILTASEEIRNALIACGLFEVVDYEVESPIFDRDVLTQMERFGMDDKIDGQYANYDGRFGNPIIGTEKRKISLIKPLGSNHNNLNGGTSKSGGSGSKGTKKVASDEKERYHVVNKQIEDVTAKYEEAGKEREKAFGPLKDSWAEKELGYLDQLIEKERQYKTEIEQYLATDKSALAAYGATFGEHGEITNYDALMDEQIAKYNAAIEKAGTNQEAQEAAEKAYDLFIKALENYEGTYSAYLDKLATIQDLQNEKIDKELQNIQDRLNAKLDLEADQLKYLDYLIGKLDDEAFALADALVSLHDKTQPIMNQSDHYAQAWEELQRTAKENGGWTQDMIDKLRELRDGLISTNEEIMELQKTIEAKVNEAIAECTDELDKQINRFDTYQSILQNYNDIIDLSGEKFKDYAMMLELSSLMTDNAINKLASSREKLETLGQAQINAQAKLELAEDSGDQDVIDYWKKTLEDIQIEVENATAEMGSAWKEALQAASDAFESQVNLAIDNFKGGLEAFGDLDMISESYDRAEKAAERYLEDFEKTHELSQLGRDITKAMNDTTSAFAKDELAELMAEVNEKQKDGVKMSEYDLEVLKKKFELKQAELALEEAQNSMSQVRLTRDNEGNWSYQYTADQDKVDEALSEYEARLYEVAKLSDEYIDEMSKAVIDNQKEMYETLAGLRAEDFASYEEYEAKVREIVNFYTTQDAYLRDELAKAVGDTEYVTTTMSGHYNNLSTSFTTVVDTMLGNTGDKTGNLKTWMESTDNLAEQAEEYFNTKLPEAYKTWEESVGEAMEAAGTNTEDFKDDVSDYMEDISDASEELADDIGNAADDMQDYIESVMDAVWDWQEEYVEDIKKMIAANEELIRSMMEVAAAQGAGSGGNKPIADYSREIATLIKNDKYDVDDDYIEELFRQRAEKDKEGKYVKNDRIKDLVAAYDDPSDPKHEDAVKVVDSVLEDKGIYFTDKYLADHGFRTGGYTGAWGPEGKMAFVHEKELILNSDDTVNFLAGVNILREIAKMIDLQAANMAMPHGFILPMSASSGGALEQNVHISASFPGVQDRNEIEIALRSLVNEASQFVLE